MTKPNKTAGFEAVEVWPIDKPRDNEANARTHPRKQIDELRESFRRYGQVWPILVNEEGEIIAGHGRRVAAALEGHKTIRVIVARQWTAAQCRAFSLMDNKVAMNASWDAAKLTAELKRVRDDGDNPLQIGFTRTDLKRLQIAEESAAPQLGELVFSVIVRCESEAQQRELLRKFEAQGLTCEALIS